MATLGAIVLAMAGIAALAPAGAQSVPEDVHKGRQVFLTAGEIGCAACHGKYAEGDVGIGPYNRGMGEDSIREAINGIEEMEFLKDEMTDEDIRQIAAYYEFLGRLQLFKVLAKRGRFIPDTIEVYPGTSIQLVVDNTGRGPQTFASPSMKIDDVTIPGREDSDIVWTAPATEGEFTLECKDCRRKLGELTIVVSRDAEQFAPAIAVAEPEVEIVALSPKERDAEMIELGRQVFLNAGEVGCVACHGQYAEGDVGIGPYNRGFSEESIRDALANVSEMAFLNSELTDAEIGQVAAYYRRLGELHLAKTRVIQGRFFPSRVEVAPGTKVQLVVNNTNTVAHVFASPDMGLEDFAVDATSEVDLVWVAPAGGGSFSLVCADCGGDAPGLTIDVAAE